MNTSYQRAFTMIELIFVIVIIGILAAVAIPKLAATRDDAKIAEIITNARTVYGDLSSFYTSQGESIWDMSSITKATDVALGTDCDNLVTSTTVLNSNTFVLCHDNVACISFETADEGNLTIADGTVVTDHICEAVKTDPAIIAISNKSYRLGGSIVQR